jgi:hypothetical protein
MHVPGIRITRYPYEEPHHLNLRIEVSNGRFQGQLEYYCNADDLPRLGKELADFTGKNKEIVYELGSEEAKDRFAFFLSLRVKTLDSSGHCALLVRMNNNKPCPLDEVCGFSITAAVADLNRLGNLLFGFGRLQHRCLEWQVHEGRLMEEPEEGA